MVGVQHICLICVNLRLWESIITIFCFKILFKIYFFGGGGEVGVKGGLSEGGALKTQSVFGCYLAGHWHHGRKQVQRSSLEGIVLSLV